MNSVTIHLPSLVLLGIYTAAVVLVTSLYHDDIPVEPWEWFGSLGGVLLFGFAIYMLLAGS